MSLSRRGVRHSSGPFPGDAVQRVVAAQTSSSALQAKETHSYVQVLLHLSVPWNMGMREGNGDFRPSGRAGHGSLCLFLRHRIEFPEVSISAKAVYFPFYACLVYKMYQETS